MKKHLTAPFSNAIRVWSLMLLLGWGTATLAQTMSRNFDHLKTGFALTGVHSSARCESCHVNGLLKGTPRDCNSCHTSGLRLAQDNVVKTAQHVPTQLGCETCHTTRTFSGAKFNHAGISASACATCHNASITSGKPASHIPTQASCANCHKTFSWLPATKMDHSTFTLATNCTSCHNGTNATGKSANHIATTANCGTCHKSFTGWTPAKFHSNVSVITGCASCHATSVYGLTAKPNNTTHNGVTVCETCHKSTNSWLSVQFGHSAANAVGTGTCDTCHNGSTSAMAKNAGHIPVLAGLAKCDSCHKSQVSFNAAVTMNHSVVSTATCKSCHSGNYVSQGNNGGALAKPANHIPETQLLNGAAMDCSACHTSTTAWTTLKMNHNASLGNGAGWCKSCHATGTTYLGHMERKSLTHDKTGQTDCSTSSCHKPLGKKGNAYTKWD